MSPTYAALVHEIDPVLFEVLGFRTWWYGLGYAVGFLGLHLWSSSTTPTTSHGTPRTSPPCGAEA